MSVRLLPVWHIFDGPLECTDRLYGLFSALRFGLRTAHVSSSALSRAFCLKAFFMPGISGCQPASWVSPSCEQ